MTYDPNIPQAGDLISNSQGQILINFTQLNTQFGVDHIAFYTGSANGNGHHKQITFDNAIAAPSPTGTISNVYPALVSAEQELEFKNASHTTQITSGGLPIWKGGTTGTTGVVASTITTNGYMLLPNGLQMMWGEVNTPGSSGTVSFSPTFPTAAPFIIQLTLYRSSGRSASVDSGTAPTQSQFKYLCDSSGSDKLFWFAIGH